MPADPVSWLVVERGWEVYGRDSEQLGHVEEVLGDEATDIFNGLVVTAGLLKTTKYVPSERVHEIVDGRITLDVDAAEFERLEDRGEAG